MLKGEEKEINIGTALLGSQKRRFLVSTGIGFDAGICHEALASKIKNMLNRLHLGKTYVCDDCTAAALFISNRSHWMQRWKTENTVRLKMFFFAVAMNFPYEGGGFASARRRTGQMICST